MPKRARDIFARLCPCHSELLNAPAADGARLLASREETRQLIRTAEEGREKAPTRSRARQAVLIAAVVLIPVLGAVGYSVWGGQPDSSGAAGEVGLRPEADGEMSPLASPENPGDGAAVPDPAPDPPTDPATGPTTAGRSPEEAPLEGQTTADPPVDRPASQRARDRRSAERPGRQMRGRMQATTIPPRPVWRRGE